MNKDELIQLLKYHKENKAKLNIKLKELKTKRLQLKGCEEIETNITTAYGINQDIHSKNQISDKVLRKIEQNDNRKNELKKEIEDLEETVRELRDKVEAVTDRLEGLKYKERELLTAYYIDGRTAEDIGNNLYFKLFGQTRSPRRIQMIVDEATEKMVKL